MSRFHRRFVLLGLAGWIAIALAAMGAEKPKITSQDQLPRFNYPLKSRVVDVVKDDAAYGPLAEAVRADLEKLLANYDIADRSTLKEILGTLMSLDTHAGRYDSALERLAMIR